MKERQASVCVVGRFHFRGHPSAVFACTDFLSQTNRLSLGLGREDVSFPPLTRLTLFSFVCLTEKISTLPVAEH